MMWSVFFTAKVSLTQSMEIFIAALTRRVTHSAFRKSQAFVHLNSQVSFLLENVVYSLEHSLVQSFCFYPITMACSRGGCIYMVGALGVIG